MKHSDFQEFGFNDKPHELTVRYQSEGSCGSWLNMDRGQEADMLEQIGMSSGVRKGYFPDTISYVYQYPISFNMAFSKSIQISMEFMLSAEIRQWFIPDKSRDYFINFINIFTAFLQEFEIFFELVGKGKLKQILNIRILLRFFN